MCSIRRAARPASFDCRLTDALPMYAVVRVNRQYTKPPSAGPPPSHHPRSRSRKGPCSSHSMASQPGAR
eukprot:11383340-Heterocapsa_arctica.AAC.1